MFCKICLHKVSVAAEGFTQRSSLHAATIIFFPVVFAMSPKLFSYAIFTKRLSALHQWRWSQTFCLCWRRRKRFPEKVTTLGNCPTKLFNFLVTDLPFARFSQKSYIQEINGHIIIIHNKKIKLSRLWFALVLCFLWLLFKTEKYLGNNFISSKVIC